MTRIVPMAVVIETLIKRGPHTVDRLSALSRANRSTVKDWVSALHAAKKVRPVGTAETPKGARGTRPINWEWVE